MKYFIKENKSKFIEPEEILLDELSAEKLDNSKLELALESRNFLIFYIFIILIFLIFLLRAFDFQVFENDKFAALAENNKTRSSPIIAKRGIIYDRDLNQLVSNVPSFDLVIIPSNLPKKKEEREKMLIELSDKFSLDRDFLIEKFVKNRVYIMSAILIKGNIKREDALFIESSIDNFKGVELRKNSVREYKYKESLAHILGYTGKVSEKNIKNNPKLSSLDFIGKSGLELFYDSLLRGENGRTVKYVDSVLNLKKERRVKDDVSGFNLVLSVDSDLQEKVYYELKKEVENNKDAIGAAAVVSNPKTGEILSLVSYPSFDPNIFSKGGEKSDYDMIFKNKSKPLFNRVISGSYPPGSSIKPFVASAALEEGVITENTKINDIGYISIKNIYNPDIVYTFRDWKIGGHGIVDVKKALTVSSNVFFYTIGGGYGDIKGLGIERIKKYLNYFGFGSVLGIDILGEKSGLIPDKKWKKENKGENWYVGDTYISSIGQGDVSATPLQVNMATSALVNGGKLMRPHILKEVLDKNGSSVEKINPEIIRKDFINEYNLKVIREGMRNSVLEGSGLRLKNFPIKVAGKTGTAQIGGDMTHAWFTSFAPYDDPELVVTVLIERGGEGSASAIPVVKEIYKHYFNIGLNSDL